MAPFGSGDMSATGMAAVFDAAVRDIELAYEQLGHRLGWRFLLTSRRTFTSGVRTLLLSFHPGGDAEPPDQPKASSEGGSAYDVEGWHGAPPGQAPLQVQVRELLAAFGENPADTLSAYFLPFRAPRRADLVSEKESIAFARELWRRLLPELAPKVILALGDDAYGCIRDVLGDPSREIRRPAGWGNQSIFMATWDDCMVVRFPHLSQFKLMSRPEGRAAVEDAARRVRAFRAGQDGWWSDTELPVVRLAPTSLPAAARTRLEKAAVDNGFDLVKEPVAPWLPAGSSHAPLDVWLTVDGDGHPVAALSRADVAAALAEMGRSTFASLPSDAEAACEVPDVGALHHLLRRAFQLARTLPNELLRTFAERTASLPRNTEAERLVVQRVGQDVFRAGLLEYWDGKCAITGLAVPELLRASHIKPWAACESDGERLDVFNGLLLAAHLDAAFDSGLITVADDATVVASPQLGPEAREVLGLTELRKIEKLTPGHRVYLRVHRETVFRRRSP